MLINYFFSSNKTIKERNSFVKLKNALIQVQNAFNFSFKLFVLLIVLVLTYILFFLSTNNRDALRWN